MIGRMPRILLLVPSATYRAQDFIAAAKAIEVDLVIGTEMPSPVGNGRGLVQIPLDDPLAAADAIEAFDREHGIDAVVAVDDGGTLAAAHAGERLGFPHSAPDSVAATRDKAEMRRRLAKSEVTQPRFGSSGAEVGYPCVVKPTGLSGSRGVIRADTAEQESAARIRIATFWDGPLLVEQYVPGVEIALEGLLTNGRLEVLAIFDKPDPLVGPYFEETMYVTPSRLVPRDLGAAERAASLACVALGLTEGPVHAEVRVKDAQAWVIEVASRSVGGLCARALRFGAGISLEEVVLRHALNLPMTDLARERSASGVTMLPIAQEGTLVAVNGRERALGVPGVVGLEITIPIGHRVVPLPEGDRYLGFLFARADSPDQVESALREAVTHLDIVIA